MKMSEASVKHASHVIVTSGRKSCAHICFSYILLKVLSSYEKEPADLNPMHRIVAVKIRSSARA